jgi:hypothetical protein
VVYPIEVHLMKIMTELPNPILPVWIANLLALHGMEYKPSPRGIGHIGIVSFHDGTGGTWMNLSYEYDIKNVMNIIDVVNKRRSRTANA